MKTIQSREAWLSSLSLLTSAGTLVCCALPALLVTLGAGAVLAGLVNAVPQIVALSELKGVVFSVAGLLLAGSAILRYVNRNAPCPANPAHAAACAHLRRIGGLALYGSIAVYAVGFFFAFLADPLLG